MKKLHLRGCQFTSVVLDICNLTVRFQIGPLQLFQFESTVNFTVKWNSELSATRTMWQLLLMKNTFYCNIFFSKKMSISWNRLSSNRMLHSDGRVYFRTPEIHLTFNMRLRKWRSSTSFYFCMKRKTFQLFFLWNKLS